MSGIAFIGTGCGQNYNGTFNGTATMSMTGMTAISSSISMTMNQNSNNTVTGSFTGPTIGSGSFQGTTNANQITITSMTMSMSNTMGYGVGTVGTTGTVGTVGTVGTTGITSSLLPGSMCPQMTFTGSLTINSNGGSRNVVGQLTSLSTGAGYGVGTTGYGIGTTGYGVGTTGYGIGTTGYGVGPMCSGTLSLNVSG